MAYTAGNLWMVSALSPGRAIYTYHTSDNVNVVETAGYFNNTDDDLKLAPGDLIHVVMYAAAVYNETGAAEPNLPNAYSLQIVTTVDPAGVVNTAEAGISTAAAISSGL